MKLTIPTTSLQIGYTPLMAASVKGDPNVVKILIHAGASVNSASQVDALVVCEAHTK